MKKIFGIFLCFLWLQQNGVFSQSSCYNIGFEEGTFDGWEGETGIWPSGNYQKTGNTIEDGRHTIIKEQGVDKYTGGVLYYIPPGHNQSVRLGNDGINAQVDKLIYRMTVDNKNTLFICKFAVVLEDPNHSKSQQPFFELSIKDANKQSLGSEECTVYGVSAGRDIPDFNTYKFSGKDSIRWRDWTSVGLDLTNYDGQTITIEIVTKDCSAGAHFGYAYFVAMCAPRSINLTYCEKDVSAKLEAPEGFKSYRWKNPNGEIIGTNREITVNNPEEGGIYKCELISHLDGCLPINLEVIVNRTVFDTKIDYTLEGCEYKFRNIDVNNNGNWDSYFWDFGDGHTSTEKNPTHIFSSPGNKTVKLTVSHSGCTDFTSTTINVIDCSCTPNTLIFKEDFGGNSIFSPVVAPQGFSSANTVSGLEYNPWTNFLLPIRLPAFTTFLLYHYNLLNPFALRTDNYSFVKKGKSRSGVWYEPYDHTYAGNPNLGYMMEVNGSSQPATCYSVLLTENLCPGSQLSFSVWGMSLMKSKNYRNAELKLVIRKPGTTTPVAWKDITIENGKGYWEPFELNYVLREGDENGLVFEIVNNSSSGENFHGNDFALDDIEVRICTPKVELRGSAWVCKRDDLKIEYINNNDFSNPTYKWFKSNSGNINGTWNEINGANGSTLLIENAELTDAGYYRLEITDGSGSCPAKSDPMRISVRDCDICADCVSSFAPVPGEKYVLSAWVKETGHSVEVDGVTLTGDDLMITSYENSIIALSFENSNEVIGAMPEGAIIDGWQRIYTEFTVPAEAVKMHLDLGNTGVGESYFDDIRVFPFNGNMKSYVYDPVTMRLVAELDNENYATFYEYDEEGALIRVKKETEKGIMTIREARQAKQKIKQP